MWIICPIIPPPKRIGSSASLHHQKLRFPQNFKQQLQLGILNAMAAMAAALLCLRPTLPLSSSSSFTSHLPPFPPLRSQAQTFGERGKCHFPKRNLVVAASPQKPTSGNGLNRRDLVLFSLSSSAASVFFPYAAISASAEVVEEVKVASFVDDINAYSFQYPTEWPDKNFHFKWVVSRKPERYSSAAPLSPDARQRIVSERVDMINNLVISVSIGPPNSSFLTSSDKSTWSAKAVADSVLSDKSALRVTTSQRLAESSVLDTHVNTIDGELYWYHEYLVRKSPTKLVQESNIYRHFVASTAERDGYLYTLSASTLNKQWPSMGPFLQKTVDSFRLLPPTENYVPPYKDPWRFW